MHYLERKNDLAKNKSEGPLVRRNAAFASAEEIQQHITALKISKVCRVKACPGVDSFLTTLPSPQVALSVTDVASLLEALTLEGRLESNTRVMTKSEEGPSGSGASLIYRIASAPPESGLAKVPCGICPVRCSRGRADVITPSPPPLSAGPKGLQSGWHHLAGAVRLHEGMAFLLSERPTPPISSDLLCSCFRPLSLHAFFIRDEVQVF